MTGLPKGSLGSMAKIIQNLDQTSSRLQKPDHANCATVGSEKNMGWDITMSRKSVRVRQRTDQPGFKQTRISPSFGAKDARPEMT
jgi:hypothetical protein